MSLLILGLLIWSILHFIPSLARPFRNRLISAWGETKYKIIFSVLMLLAIVLIVLGWRSMVPIQLYVPPLAPGLVPGLLVLAAFILFAAAHAKTNLKRYLRHPQLTGMVLWSAAHLLANGDNRSLILFASLGVWALVEILLINKREGLWTKPDPVPLKSEIPMILIGITVYVIFLFLHPFLFGVSPFPR